ncbi:MAG TPA: cation-translocating P-type ATPase [Candidatus Merdenecus merdavium]|nr:cation-translocating P-type ATPase [Candidatus Merdenecus merdavium]
MYEEQSIKQVVETLKTDPQMGLSQEMARQRLSVYGKNELVQAPPKTKIAMLLEQLNDPLIFILFVAATISILLQEFSDAAIILVVIFINAVVGIIQEGKALKALEALKKMTSPTAFVKRDGAYVEIPANQLVPGDVVKLEAGRQVPADLRLISSASLKLEEAALTGESVPVEKDASFRAAKALPIGDRKNIVYMSTSVIYGHGKGIVISTGMETEIGKIAGMINDTTQESTPLQKRLGDLGKLLSFVAILLCVALFGIAVIQKRDILEMLITAISLAVAAVPEGLPAVVTIVLALSVSRMVKVNTIVRRLPSVETLGAVSIVCSDKTGTLTQNRMTVVECYTNQTLFPVDRLNITRHRTLIEGFMLCNDASMEQGEGMGDPTELALVEMGKDIGLVKSNMERLNPRVSERPFDSTRKMMTTVHRGSSGSVSYTKGSCDTLLRQCSHIFINGKKLPMTQGHRKEIKNAMSHMANQALRVLGLAMKQGAVRPEEEGLTFVGMVGMIDPPRPEVYSAIELFKEASVKTIMITGDHIDTAFAIAKDLGIAKTKEECISGEDLNEMTDQELKDRIQGLRVFARVSPQHKVRIVNTYKALGHIVAMTGDGVNDAPSLKSADIGIAMGMNGTDVAKNASDIILTDDNFATIEKAIEEGRGVYENIKKSVLFLLSSNFGEIITMFFSILVGLASPLKASHILWVNLITDSLPALALGTDENNQKLLMNKPPRHPKESLFAHGGLACTLFYGSLIAVISLAAFLITPYRILVPNGLPFTLSNITAALGNDMILVRSQTYAFTVLGISELFHAIGMRNVELSVFKMDHKSNKLMIVAFFLGLFLQVIVTEVPYLVNLFGTVRLTLKEWGFLVGLSSMPLVAHEFLIFAEALFHPRTKKNPTFTKKETNKEEVSKEQDKQQESASA